MPCYDPRDNEPRVIYRGGCKMKVDSSVEDICIKALEDISNFDTSCTYYAEIKIQEIAEEALTKISKIKRTIKKHGNA